MPLPYLDQAQTVSIVSVRVTMPSNLLPSVSLVLEPDRLVCY
jgi:hypothetical protein